MPRYLRHALLLLLACAALIEARERVEGHFSENLKRPGYHLVTIIPEGATSINVTELSRTKNYLAVRIHDGPYLFNENNNIGWSGKYAGAGTNFTYTRRRHDQQESFYSVGPLTSSIDVMILYGKGRPNVFFTYELPIDFKSTTSDTSNSMLTESQDLQFSSTTQLLSKTSDNLMMSDEMRSSTTMSTRKVGRRRTRFVWRSAKYSRCSKSCGGGYQTKLFICINNRTKNQVMDKKCAHSPKPTAISVRCNSVPCPPQWEAGKWGKCSVSCGNGTRTRDLLCIQEMSETLKISVPAHLCPKERRTKVSLKEPCFMPDCRSYTTPKSGLPIVKNASPHWKVSEWSPCSSTCGYGKRTRSVTCVPRGKACNLRERPISEQKCNLGSCKSKDIEDNLIPQDYTDSVWLYSEWPEECPNECGNGSLSRRLYCEATLKNKTCDERNLPAYNKTCNNNRKDECSGKWFYGPWTKCSASCDVGIVTREVVCVSFFLGSPKVVNDKNCRGERPGTVEICNAPPCNATWFISDWSKCSQRCGGGTQYRTVKCIGPDELPTDSLECAAVKKPLSKKICNEDKCKTSIDESNAITSADSDNSVDRVCQDTLSDCPGLRLKSKESKDKCETDYYKVGCCKACQYLNYVSGNG